MRGRNISSPIHIADWLRTFAGLAGMVVTDDAPPGVPGLDSIDQWPVISGAAPASARLRNETYVLEL
jgi:hypothetical protein